jgi:hypothetical protein
LSPLLAAVSHTLGKSSVAMFPGYSQGFVLYSALLANPSTGKTNAMSLIKKALVTCEKILNKDSESTTNILNDMKKIFSIFVLLNIF